MIERSGVFDTVENGLPSQLRFVLRRPGSRMNVNGRNRFGQTPLMVAASRGGGRIATQFIQALIRSGADHTAKDCFQRDLLFYCVIFGHDSVSLSLIASGDFDLAEQDNQGRTVLSHAVTLDRVRVVAAIVEWAVSRGDTRLLYIADNRGHTPLDHALYMRNSRCVQLLSRASNQFTMCRPTTDPAVDCRCSRLSTGTDTRATTDTVNVARYDCLDRAPNNRRGQSVMESVGVLMDMKAGHKLNRPTTKPLQLDLSRADQGMDAYELTVRRFREERARAAETARLAALPRDKHHHHPPLQLPSLPSRFPPHSDDNATPKRSRRGSLLTGSD